ncbi:MAG: helix-turn-helix domain-containing protein [Carbonactinosporaceae bacterium]
MSNELLRKRMATMGWTHYALAEKAGVDPKTVERWVNNGRTPHRGVAMRAAEALGEDVLALWPALRRERPRTGLYPELVAVYQNRASVPRETWLRLLGETQQHIDVLVFSGTFFAQVNPQVAQMLAEAAERGVRVRMCFGDPASQAVAIRDREEGINDTLGHKIRSSLTYYRPLLGQQGCEVRLHPTALYASLFRYDAEILVNPHAYGEPASANPVLHLQRREGSMIAEHYMGSFERVWTLATPWRPEEE